MKKFHSNNTRPTRWLMSILLSLIVLSLSACKQDEVKFFGIDKEENLRLVTINIAPNHKGLFYASYLDGDTVVDMREEIKAQKLSGEDGYNITLVSKGISFKLIRDGQLLYCLKYKCVGCDNVQVEDVFSTLPKIWGRK